MRVGGLAAALFSHRVGAGDLHASQKRLFATRGDQANVFGSGSMAVEASNAYSLAVTVTTGGASAAGGTRAERCAVDGLSGTLLP